MSMRVLPAKLRDLRALAIAALACAAIAAYSQATWRYHEFFAGITIGLLLVLVVQLFRAHPAEVEPNHPQE